MVKQTKKFSGKTYNLSFSFHKRETAEYQADQFRKDGFHYARVTKQVWKGRKSPNHVMYFVWLRRKK